ncbi:hypothetical protein RRF57_010684 [Xylaria bambusicola]|uniref:Uncharacterized protein n=1 Tax=Xylaria bambusicola TaxID=326684 RepID=A0AAN7Z9N9_9PEZI
MATKSTLDGFESVFPKLEGDLLNWAKGYSLPQQYLKWYNEVRWTSTPFYLYMHVSLSSRCWTQQPTSNIIIEKGSQI